MFLIRLISTFILFNIVSSTARPITRQSSTTPLTQLTPLPTTFTPTPNPLDNLNTPASIPPWYLQGVSEDEPSESNSPYVNSLPDVAVDVATIRASLFESIFGGPISESQVNSILSTARQLHLNGGRENPQTRSSNVLEAARIVLQLLSPTYEPPHDGESNSIHLLSPIRGSSLIEDEFEQETGSNTHDIDSMTVEQEPSVADSSFNSQVERERCATPYDGGYNLDQKKIILDLVDKNYKESSIMRKYPKYRRQYLKGYREAVENHGTTRDKRKQIDADVWRRFQEARRRFLEVRGETIQNWAIEKADSIGCNNFVASNNWLWDFKNRHRISSRAGKKTKSQREIDNEQSRRDSIDIFRREFARNLRFFQHSRIWNTDQSGFNYELVTSRTLSHKGERDTLLYIGHQNDDRKSYTVQPTISRDGRLVGKLQLCMKETNGEFGVNVKKTVDDLERKYGNIRVFASKNGNMDGNLIRDWAEITLSEAINRESELSNRTEEDNLERRYREESQSSLDGNADAEVGIDDSDRSCYSRSMQQQMNTRCGPQTRSRSANTQIPPGWSSLSDPQPGPSWMTDPPIPTTRGQRRKLANDSRSAECFDHARRAADATCLEKPKILLLADMAPFQMSENQIMRLRGMKAKVLKIPAGTTDEVQPLDVGFFRQLKLFAKRVSAQARYDRISVRTREEVINLQSLMYNQLQAAIYRDLLRYSWHRTDPNFFSDELECPIVQKNGKIVPREVKDINFNLQRGRHCEITGCNHSAFIKCAHCGRHLCLKHFLDRHCFHGEGQSYNPLIQGLDCYRDSYGEENEDILIDDDIVDDVYYMDEEVFRNFTSTTARSRGPDDDQFDRGHFVGLSDLAASKYNRI